MHHKKLIMEIEPFHETPPVEPVYDTWGGKTDAGSWCIAPNFVFKSLSVQEVNDWFAITLEGTLDAFSHVARACNIYFTSIYRDDIKGMKFDWQTGNSYELYLKNVLIATRTYPAPIHMMEIEVDLFAFFRTKDFPKTPVKAWARLPTQFIIWGGPEKRKPYLCLEMDHTLFRPYSRDGEENKELYFLNQPLLEQALRRWEERFGSISDVDGLIGVYQYGFLAEI
ncbi:hypothetical protein SAMN06265795_116121 [Noviherbaspirillum humi]|uniref:Uncharacterized protein n=1 Tax=Noviherbaspirillum humi TaxID=1688639 RepID=A0A239KMS9_9BURK|nr:hypothetical protein [Noviherbaspirillum humi]SNT19687.1 hypothetical protein SAMN06265795_116121 [Noviherbaspirillum humi]